MPPAKPEDLSSTSKIADGLGRTVPHYAAASSTAAPVSGVRNDVEPFDLYPANPFSVARSVLSNDEASAPVNLKKCIDKLSHHVASFEFKLAHDKQSITAKSLEKLNESFTIDNKKIHSKSSDNATFSAMLKSFVVAFAKKDPTMSAEVAEQHLQNKNYLPLLAGRRPIIVCPDAKKKQWRQVLSEYKLQDCIILRNSKEHTAEKQLNRAFRS